MANEQTQYQDRIVRTPGVVGGKPVIKGTRIPVDLILERLTYDLDLKTLFEDYPQLTQEDIKACFEYAKELVEEEELVRFICNRLMTAFPPPQRSQFVALLEQEASEEALRAFTIRHFPNLPAFVMQTSIAMLKVSCSRFIRIFPVCSHAAMLMSFASG